MLTYGNQNAQIEIINYTSFQCGAYTILYDELRESIEKQIDIKRFKF